MRGIALLLETPRAGELNYRFLISPNHQVETTNVVDFVSGVRRAFPTTSNSFSGTNYVAVIQRGVFQKHGDRRADELLILTGVDVAQSNLKLLEGLLLKRLPDLGRIANSVEKSKGLVIESHDLGNWLEEDFSNVAIGVDPLFIKKQQHTYPRTRTLTVMGLLLTGIVCGALAYTFLRNTFTAASVSNPTSSTVAHLPIITNAVDNSVEQLLRGLDKANATKVEKDVIVSCLNAQIPGWKETARTLLENIDKPFSRLATIEQGNASSEANYSKAFYLLYGLKSISDPIDTLAVKYRIENLRMEVQSLKNCTSDNLNIVCKNPEDVKILKILSLLISYRNTYLEITQPQHPVLPWITAEESNFVTFFANWLNTVYDDSEGSKKLLAELFKMQLPRDDNWDSQKITAWDNIRKGLFKLDQLMLNELKALKNRQKAGNAP